MLELLFTTPLIVAAVAWMYWTCRPTGRPSGSSWFDLMPYMRPSKKARGRGDFPSTRRR